MAKSSSLDQNLIEIFIIYFKVLYISSYDYRILSKIIPDKRHLSESSKTLAIRGKPVKFWPNSKETFYNHFQVNVFFFYYYYSSSDKLILRKIVKLYLMPKTLG